MSFSVTSLTICFWPFPKLCMELWCKSSIRLPGPASHYDLFCYLFFKFFFFLRKSQTVIDFPLEYAPQCSPSIQSSLPFWDGKDFCLVLTNLSKHFDRIKHYCLSRPIKKLCILHIISRQETCLCTAQ